MANKRIETSISMFSASEGSGLFTKDEMEKDIERYWGISLSERVFIIPFWKAEQLIENSNLKMMALNVSNIENPSLVDAEWISFNVEENLPLVSTNTGDQIKEFIFRVAKQIPTAFSEPIDEACFAFGANLFDGLKSFKPHKKMTVAGRLGRTTAGISVVYFVVGEITYKLEPGTGGGGATTGGKIPTQ